MEGSVLFDNFDSNFVFSQLYLEFKNRINTDFLVGMGERNGELRLKQGKLKFLYTVAPIIKEYYNIFNVFYII